MLQNDHSARFSSKGKTPWMEYNGVAVADSQLCIEYLKEIRGIDLDSKLTAEQRAIARGFLKLTEENLYWYNLKPSISLACEFLATVFANLSRTFRTTFVRVLHECRENLHVSRTSREGFV